MKLCSELDKSVRYVPSRYNVRVQSNDGELLLYNTFIKQKEGFVYKLAARIISLAMMLVVLAPALSNPLAQPAGGTLTIASGRELSSLNPFSEDPGAAELMPLFLGTLLEINPQSRRLEPALAERYTTSADGKELTITLHTTKFSDGTPFTADDVLFTFNDIFLNTKLRTKTLDLLREFLKVGGQPLVQSVTRVDERTVRFMFNAPVPTSFLILLAQIPVLPKHKLQEKDVTRVWGVGTKPEEIIGLGPFKIAEFARNRIVLARNDFYWKRDAQGALLPRLGQVIWLGGQRNLLQQFRDGKVDLFEPSAEEALSLPVTAKLITGGPRTLYLALFINQDVTDAEKRALFRDVRFRQALAHATDRAALVKLYRSGSGLAAPRESFLNPLSPFYDETNLVRYPFDLAQAATLLDQVGLKDADGDGWRDLPSKKSFNLTFLIPQDDPTIRYAEVFQANLSKVNLKAAIEITGDWQRRITANPPQYEATMASHTVVFFEMPFVILQVEGMFSSKGDFHRVYRPSDASGQEVTQLQKEIDQILVQLPMAQNAQALFARLQRLVSEDVPVLPLFSPQYLVAVQPSVKNAEVINAYGYARFLELLRKE